MQPSIYLALDVRSVEEARYFLENHHLEGVPVKVGMQLFYSEGHRIIDYLKRKHHPIFLDLKLHDIPNTVYEAMRQLALYEPSIVNIHAAGGSRMIEAAKEALIAENSQSQLLAVTQLTSTDETMLESELLIQKSMAETVQHYAHISQESGADGVVCSVHEVPLIKQYCGLDFKTLTPGIRLANGAHHDQTRVATPRKANEVGSDMIVVGRAVTQADEPKQIYQSIVKEWSYASANNS
ncbi:orotidine-5'-phosphate decarboxylase [Alkalibacillus salilacus]|uniref:Orotidine 5'-phosphate decarboxylase n=1 Tax=Alkalibacillus salilacus TaxID=284582 RepID=A0ABT9VE73_9BACI|nr:orotidine-5'-phosphate decarboxylase [Alkalibacillus salilacus]MDQ0159155.1 orotidine-5'-phosphate decarboxylase [Alkalibacillus salilacus]